MARWVKKTPAVQETQETQVCSLGGEAPLEEEMATHSSILAWRVPRTEGPVRPVVTQSMGSQRVGHDCSNLALIHANFNWSEVKCHRKNILHI